MSDAPRMEWKSRWAETCETPDCGMTRSCGACRATAYCRLCGLNEMCSTCRAARSEFKVPWDMEHFKRLPAVHRASPGLPAPLHVACYRGKLGLVEEQLGKADAESAKLIGAGAAIADVDGARQAFLEKTVSGDQQTALSYAVRKGRLAIVGRLLEARCDPLAHDCRGASLVHSCAETKDDGTIARTILCSIQGAKSSSAYGTSKTSDWLRKQMLAKRDQDGFTAWHRACAHGNGGLMKLLLEEYGQDCNQPLPNGNTAAHILAELGLQDLLSWLLNEHELQHTPMREDCDGKPAGWGGNTPLHVAATSKRWGVAQLLVAHGSDSQIQNNDRKIPPLTIGWQKATNVHMPGAGVPTLVTQPKPIPCSGGGHWVTWGRAWTGTKIERVAPVKKARMRVATGAAKKKKAGGMSGTRTGMDHGCVGFTADAIEKVIELMDPNGDGDIDLQELAASIRLFKRASATDKSSKAGKKVIKKLIEHMDAHGLTVRDLFHMIDTSGDGTISGKELADGLELFAKPAAHKNLTPEGFAEYLGVEQDEANCMMLVAEDNDHEDHLDAKTKLDLYRDIVEKSKKVTVISKAEIDMIRHYMDPNGDGAVDIFELEAGFKRAGKSSMQDSIEDEVIPIINLLEGYMNKRSMRLVDLFAEFDTDNSGSVSTEELREGLKRLASPVVKTSKTAKMRAEKMLAKRQGAASAAQKKRDWMIDPTGWKKKQAPLIAIERTKSSLEIPASSFARVGLPWNWHKTAAAKTHKLRLQEDAYEPPRALSAEPIKGGSCKICNGNFTSCAVYHDILDAAHNTFNLSSSTNVNRKQVELQTIGPFHRYNQ